MARRRRRLGSFVHAAAARIGGGKWKLSATEMNPYGSPYAKVEFKKEIGGRTCVREVHLTKEAWKKTDDFDFRAGKIPRGKGVKRLSIFCRKQAR